MAQYHEVDPISRIEGHLGIKVELDASGEIIEANSHANLWRGFENFLIGRAANDAITFTQRICGVCPLPHATASMFNVESVLGVSDGYITWETAHATNQSMKGVPAKAVLIRNIVYACEFLMSNITHFYHLVAPSYVQGPAISPWTPYFHDTQYHGLLRGASGTDATGGPDAHGLGGLGILPDADATGSTDLWSAVITQYVKALRIRRLALEAGALFAGRMPMVASFVAGGVTNKTETQASWEAKCDAFRTIMVEVANFCVREYIPLAVALGYLYTPFDNNAGANGFGAGCGNLLAWGAFPNTGTGDDTALAFLGGYSITDEFAQAAETHKFMEQRSDTTGLADHGVEFVKNNLVEYIVRSNYKDELGEFDASGKAYPGGVIDASGNFSAVTRTIPDRTGSVGPFTSMAADNDDGYSWMKAPRIKSVADGEYYPMEVGPFARMNINDAYFSNNTGNDQYLFLRGSSPWLTAYGSLYGKATSDPTAVEHGGGWWGLDPDVIGPDLAHALVLEGAVKMSSDGAAIIDDGLDIVTKILTMKCGYSTMDRLRARAIETFWLCTWILGGTFNKGTSTWVPAIGTAVGDGWINQLEALYGVTGYKAYAVPPGTTVGMGVSEAPRGALAHFASASSGKIIAYQCVVPTTWNGSPKDGATGASGTRRGPIEAAVVGATFEEGLAISVTNFESGDAGGATAESGVEVLRIAQSFDPCIACAVH
ncbi:MAG: nickel-dependent hydrogenase large subunit [Actinomycetota bacterium]|nr:nickel-dependent hydrogenase large subunit [Actinomycetota bacterium]